MSPKLEFGTRFAQIFIAMIFYSFAKIERERKRERERER
jgi:DNA invertase Pin-like site-specific DNA recombinase